MVHGRAYGGGLTVVPARIADPGLTRDNTVPADRAIGMHRVGDARKNPVGASRGHPVTGGATAALLPRRARSWIFVRTRAYPRPVDAPSGCSLEKTYSACSPYTGS